MEDEITGPQDSAPAAPPRLTILHCAGLVILLYVLAQWIILILGRQTATPTDFSWIEQAVIGGIPGLLVAHAGAVLAGYSIPDLLRLRMTVSLLVTTLFMGAGLFIVLSALATVLQKLHYIPELIPLDHLMKQKFAGILFLVALVAPLTEELIFRGIMFQGLRESYNLSTGVFVSSFLFALIHLHPWAIINAFLIGVFLCWLMMKTGSLSVCIFVHAIYNAIPFVLAKNGLISFAEGKPETFEFFPTWFVILGFGFLAAGIWLVYSFREPILESMEEAEQPA